MMYEVCSHGTPAYRRITCANAEIKRLKAELRYERQDFIERASIAAMQSLIAQLTGRLKADNWGTAPQ
jgi:hypothetical protein